MKGKRPYLWVLAAVGLVLWAVPLALYAKGVFLPTVLWIPIYGVGLVLFLGSLGTLFWRACLESDPVLRQHDHVSMTSAIPPSGEKPAPKRWRSCGWG